MICECGHPIDVTSNPDRRDVWVAEKVTCWACAAKARTSKGTNSAGPGVRWRVKDRSADG